MGCNNVAKKSSYDLFLYSHDDMYFCPDWDKIVINEVNNIGKKIIVVRTDVFLLFRYFRMLRMRPVNHRAMLIQDILMIICSVGNNKI